MKNVNSSKIEIELISNIANESKVNKSIIILDDKGNNRNFDFNVSVPKKVRKVFEVKNDYNF
ncbi:MAG: hypothetical protein MJ214_03035 [Bacilli bacterium]|nr:hypothetical protein [Bacilli bacterium]